MSSIEGVDLDALRRANERFQGTDWKVGELIAFAQEQLPVIITDLERIQELERENDELRASLALEQEARDSERAQTSELDSLAFTGRFTTEEVEDCAYPACHCPVRNRKLQCMRQSPREAK